MKDLLQHIFDCVLGGDMAGVKTNVQTALEADLDPADILKEGMIAAMKEVGHRFEQGEYYIPEMLIAARAMKEGLSILRPLLSGDRGVSAGRVIIGTVRGDLHDIGKNLVSMMLEGSGFEIIDLGTDVPPERFAEAVVESGAVIVGMSALLTTTMVEMKATIDAFQEAGLRDKVKVIIGGAPVTKDYAQQIGADGYAPDASRAVGLAESLLAVQS